MDQGLKVQKHWTTVENIIEKTTGTLNVQDTPAEGLQ